MEIRFRIRKRVYKRPLFTMKKKVNDHVKVNSKYGVVRFITKLIKRNDESPDSIVSPVSKVETKPFGPERVVKFIQIFRNKIDS
jgi:hypothetical protein